MTPVVLDTNAAIYITDGKVLGGLPAGDYVVSFITEIELLRSPTLTPGEKDELLGFLDVVDIAPMSRAIRDEAIRLRRDYRLKTPDAIIAGTALALGALLVTNDRRMLDVPGLSTQSLTLTP